MTFAAKLASKMAGRKGEYELVYPEKTIFMLLTIFGKRCK